MNTMPRHAPPTSRIEEQLAEAGLQVTVESSDGAVILSGIVDTEEARQAAADIVAQIVPNAQIDNQIDVETLVPTDVDRLVSDQPSADGLDSGDEIVAMAAELDPDFGGPLPSAALDSSGSDTGGEEDIAQSGEVYVPPTDPVVTTDLHGRTQVLGGFDSSTDDGEVDQSSDGAIGDEALADAVRRELRQDSATTDLRILVVVRNGVAHLRGQVEDLDDADNAESVASRVPGIREVVEELEVVNV